MGGCVHAWRVVELEEEILRAGVKAVRDECVFVAPPLFL